MKSNLIPMLDAKCLVILLGSLFLLSSSVHSAAAQNQVRDAAVVDDFSRANTTPSAAAFGFETFRLGGVFGHHAETMMKGNLLQLDMEKDFIAPFRERIIREPAGAAPHIYFGIGKTLDAAVHFAAWTGDKEIIDWKDKWIGELIGTMDPDGYIATCPRGASARVSRYVTHETGVIILALANDYKFFGHRRSLEAALKMADYELAKWPEDNKGLRLWTVEYPLIRLSEVSGDPKYLDFVRTRFFPDNELDGQWSRVLGAVAGHAYRWCDIHISMLDLNCHHPHPNLTSTCSKTIDHLKDGGSLPTGSFALNEQIHKGQFTRDHSREPERPRGGNQVGESCAKFYMVQFLDRLNQSNPNVFHSDVIERTYYNGIFGSMSADGRKIHYGLGVEGTRIYFHLDTYCCAGNLRRAFAYLPKYFYTLNEEQIFVNLYGESEARLRIADGRTITLIQETDYPLSGDIRFRVEPSSPVSREIAFRIPAWCKNPKVLLNGKPVEGTPQPGTFFNIEREWVAGDTVVLDFPMPWRWIAGIRRNEGKAALARGPAIYSLDPFASGLDYIDHTPITPPVGRVHDLTPVENDEPHQTSFLQLEKITLDPASVSELEVEAGFANTTLQGWLGKPGESAAQSFVFRTFDQPEGRKIYFNLSSPTVAVKDELFGADLRDSVRTPGNVVFHETFESSSETGLNAIDWGVNIGSAAQTFDANANGTISPMLSRGNFIFFLADGNSAGKPWIAWTEKASVADIGDMSDLIAISINLNNGNATTENIRIALKVDDKWYVSRNGLNGTRWTAQFLEVKSSSWDTLSFIPDTILAVESPITLPSSGTVQAVGVFNEGTANGIRVRVKDFKVEVHFKNENL